MEKGEDIIQYDREIGRKCLKRKIKDVERKGDEAAERKWETTDKAISLAMVIIF